MALKWLTAEEMVVTSAAWVMRDELARKAIEKVPLLLALLPKLEAVHGDLVQLLAKEPPKLRALSQKESEVDAKHDALVRGIVGTLTMLASLSDDREELLALRDKLFPEGLLHTKQSYRGEAGHAAVIAKQLDDPMKARLKSIVVHQKTLLDLVLAWTDAGSELMRLEEEKARLTETSPSVGFEIQTARSSWLRLAKALMANAQLAEIDDATDQLLFSTLRTAERAAANRAPAKAPVPVPTPPVAPTK